MQEQGVHRPAPPDPPRWQQCLAVLPLCLILGALAYVFLFVVSIDVFSRKAYDYEWRSRGGFHIGFLEILTIKKSGTEHYRGIEAIRWGVGFAAFGGMLALWTLALLWNLLFPWKPGQTSITWVGWSLTLLALCCLLTAAVSFFPPWRIGTELAPSSFWAMGALYLIILRLDEIARERWCRVIFFGLILLAITTGYFTAGIPTGLVLGLFAWLLAAGHLMMLVPRWRQLALGAADKPQ